MHRAATAVRLSWSWSFSLSLFVGRRQRAASLLYGHSSAAVGSAAARRPPDPGPASVIREARNNTDTKNL
jgi:hypothetical protein